MSQQFEKSLIFIW